MAEMALSGEKCVGNGEKLPPVSAKTLISRWGKIVPSKCKNLDFKTNTGALQHIGFDPDFWTSTSSI